MSSCQVSPKMDIIAISDISEKEDLGFLTNVEIEGYDNYHTASKSLKGGTAINVNKGFNSMECFDLKINNVEFESTWIGIINKNSKHIVIGSLYRHLHNNFIEFFQYLEGCLYKIAKESRVVPLGGDFNFGLVKIHIILLTFFFNLLCCYGFFPLILHPTRLTANSATVIGNIFSNNIQDEMASGNVVLTLSKHFSQFISIKREKIDIKKSYL